MVDNRIVIISDSCALPRNDLEYEKTYPYLLKEKYKNMEIIINATRMNSIKNVFYNKANFFKYYNPDIVIIHLGIIDSFPRPFPFGQLSLSVFKKFRIDKLLKKTGLYYKLSDLFNFKVTSLNQYKLYFADIIEEIKNKTKHIILLGIINPSKIVGRCKTFQTEACKYNQVIKDIALQNNLNYIDLSNLDESYTIWDGFHFNEKASEYIKEKICSIIETYNMFFSMGDIGKIICGEE